MVRPCKFNTYAVHGQQFWQKGSYLDMLSEWPEEVVEGGTPCHPPATRVGQPRTWRFCRATSLVEETTSCLEEAEWKPTGPR